MILLVDIGNTSVKLGLAKQDNIFWSTSIDLSMHVDVVSNVSRVEEILANNKYSISDVKAVVVSSVKPGLSPIFEELSKKNDLPFYKMGLNLKYGIEINTKTPDKVGTDIVANAIAANKMFNGNAIVVSLGTATTVSLIQDGKLEGASILPGLITGLKSLVEKTSLLPEISLNEFDGVVGKDTIEAMNSGLIWGHIGSIDYLVNKYKEVCDAPVLITGGNSRFIKHLYNKYKYEDDLVLTGLLASYNLTIA